MRLIDADELRAKYQAILDRGDMFCEYDIIGMLDNAPTVELDESVIQAVLNKRCMTAVANEYLVALHSKRPQGEQAERALAIIDRLRTDEHINNKECGTLRRAILLPERPTEVNCSHCDYFKFSQSFIENVVKFMTEYKIESVEDLMKELDHINEWLGGKNNEAR